jgi:histidine triad (HIT) family protein
MSERCSFCLIASGRGQAAVVHEEPDLIAFMDSRPIRPGHVLVIPRAHATDIFGLASDEYSRLLAVACALAKAIQHSFQPKRVGMVVAGFEVRHAHLHLIPMWEYHDITSRGLLDGTLVRVAFSDLQASASRLRAELVRTRAVVPG